MKKTDCKHYKPIIIPYGRGKFAIHTLVDEICLKDDKPLYLGQYDCDYCTAYEKKGK